MKLKKILATAAEAIGLGKKPEPAPLQPGNPEDIPITPGRVAPLWRRIRVARRLGKDRSYKFKGPHVKLRQTRLNFIWDSMRQANEIAWHRRQQYLQRRTDRWRKLVEQALPPMLDAELKRVGVEF